LKKQYLLISLSFLLIVIAFIYISDCNQNVDLIKPSVFINVSYGKDPLQKYDIYLPENRSSEKTKVIVFIHGGGWTNGDKDNTDKMVLFLRKQHPNHAIVSTNYRLANPNSPIKPAFPNQFLDIGFVIDHIESQKEVYQILPEFGLIGSSAGSHLALMYDYVYDTGNRVKMVCSIVGPTDLTDSRYEDNPKFNLYSKTLIDYNKYPKNTNHLEAVSPLFQVSPTSSPTILFYGKQDDIVPLSNGKKLSNALTSASVNNKFIVFDGGHGDYWSDNFKNQLTEFVKIYLPILK